MNNKMEIDTESKGLDWQQQLQLHPFWLYAGGALILWLMLRK